MTLSSITFQSGMESLHAWDSIKEQISLLVVFAFLSIVFYVFKCLVKTGVVVTESENGLL